MRFLRRGGAQAQEPDFDAFWAWWASERESIARSIAMGAAAARADEISKAVERLDPKLAWELAPGASAEHALIVTAEGNPELRPIALRWAASAPAPDATWEYHPSRQAGTLGALKIGGTTVSLGEMRVIASWDDARERMAVRVWHRAFAAIPGNVRGQAVFLFLDGLLGEDDVERWIGEVGIDEAAAAGSTPAELQELVSARAAAATGERWELVQGTDNRGNPVLISRNAALKRIDLPYSDQHLEVVVDAGIDQMQDPEVADAVRAAEDELDGALTGVAMQAGRRTERRARTTHYVAADGEAAKRIADDWVRRNRRFSARVTVRRDVRWEFLSRMG